jgi:hypothetical protein
VAAISLTYEFATEEQAVRFITRGTALGLMHALRYGSVVHIVTVSDEVQDVHKLAKSLGGEAVG